MITVETLPMRMTAVQWHQPGDAKEFGEQSYRLGPDHRYGIPSMQGMLPLHPGDWVVTAGGAVRVYSNGEFHNKFRVIEEPEA